MTFAPPTLRDLEALWNANGGTPLGIVGDTAHATKGVSYHLGADQLTDTAYSAVLPRDKAGLTNAASAIDLGKLGGSLTGLQRFSRYLVGWCLAGMPGSRDIREVIYSPNGQTPIHRYSGLDNKVYTGPGSGDNSHLYHTHISYWRDSEFRDKREPLRAYFAGIALPDTGTAPAQPEAPMVNVKCLGPALGTVSFAAGHQLINPADVAIRFPGPGATYGFDQTLTVFAQVDLATADGTPMDVSGNSPAQGGRDQCWLVQNPAFGVAALALRQDCGPLVSAGLPTATTYQLTATTAPDGKSVTVTLRGS